MLQGSGDDSHWVSRMNPMKTKENMEIQEVWAEFHKTRDDYHRNLLMEHYIDIVRYSAKRLSTRLPAHVELDDLISAGIFGLMDAIDAYDPSRGVKFETYCAPRIKGSILDELRSMDWVPKLVRIRAQQLSRATDTLKLNLGRKPFSEEIAEEMNVEMDSFQRLNKDAKPIDIVSLNAKCSSDGGGRETVEIELIPNTKSKDPVTETLTRDLKNLLANGLSRSERLVLVLYYYEEMTMKEIGTTLGLGEARVSQIHSSAVGRLKAQIDCRKNEFSFSCSCHSV